MILRQSRCSAEVKSPNSRLSACPNGFDNLPGLSFLPSQVLFLSFEHFLRELGNLVQTGCTIKLFSVSAHHLHELSGFTPTNELEIRFWILWQMLVNGHEALAVPYVLRPSYRESRHHRCPDTQEFTRGSREEDPSSV
jgi:hypothetical protein